jgi:cell wall-associated NlpC family hydrolase
VRALGAAALGGLFGCLGLRAETPRTVVVTAPVVDVRREPVASVPSRPPYALDPLQETQAIWNEPLLVLEEKDGWWRVEAPEQPEFSHGDRWQGYPGWVRPDGLRPIEGLRPVASTSTLATTFRPWTPLFANPKAVAPIHDVPLGSRAVVVETRGRFRRLAGPDGEDRWGRRKDWLLPAERPSTDDGRRRWILAAAARLRGDPYFWGGRAPHRNDRAPSGVDCSGLVNLAYRSAGVDIPRDAHEQYLRARPLASLEDLRPADLLFLAKPDAPGRVTHVMLYAGGGDVLEAASDAGRVRRVALSRKLGAPVRGLRQGQTVNGRVIHLGRLLDEHP